MGTESDTVKTMSEEVRKFLSDIGKKGGSSKSPAKKKAAEKAWKARSEYCKQRRENKETQ